MLNLTEIQYRRWLAGGLLLAAVFYCLSFERRELWTDEGFRLRLMNGNRTWGQQLTSSTFASTADVLNAVGPEQYQPAYYLLGNAVLRVTGQHSATVVRLSNIVWMLLAIVGVVRLFPAWPPLARLYLFLVFACNGYFLMHMTQMREYAMYLAIATWSVVAYFHLYDRPSGDPWPRPVWIAYIFLGALGLYTHVYFAFLLLAQALFAWSNKQDRKSFLIAIYSGLLVMGVLVVPWLLFLAANFPNRFDPGDSSMGHPQTVAFFLERMRFGFRVLLNYNDTVSRDLWQPAALVAFLDAYALLAAAGVLAAAVYAVRNFRRTQPRVLFGLLSLVVFLAFQTGWFFTRDFLSLWIRYFIGNYLGVMILLAFGFKTLLELGEAAKSRLPQRLAVALLALTATASAAQIYNFWRFPYVDTALTLKCGWRDVALGIGSRIRKEDTVIYYHPLQAWTFSPILQTPAQESSYWLVKDGNFPRTATIWVVDTKVDQALFKQSYKALITAGYNHTSTERLGCTVDLLRFDAPFASD